MLKTPENLNVGGYLPLHEALQYCHTDYVLYLIKLGAKVDAEDIFDKNPIDHYVSAYLDDFHKELFLKLILSERSILVYKISEIIKERVYKFEVMSQMFMYLLQYLVITKLDAINVGIWLTFHDKNYQDTRYKIFYCPFVHTITYI